MARADLAFPVRVLSRVFRPPAPPSDSRRLRQAEARHRSLAQAEEQWLSVLREMEQNGESSESKYERYYQAYTRIKQQQKELELELFNLRNGYFS